MSANSKDRIEIIRGDITTLKVDAIVNAANTALSGGGGVDGAIHQAAGPELMAECSALQGCPTGEARITRGYNLPAKHVIHAVGPVWFGGAKNEEADLTGAYRFSLNLAREYKLESIAFPCISTGIYGFPLDRACRIVLKTLIDYFEESAKPEGAPGKHGGAEIKRIILVCFSPRDLEEYRKAVRELNLEIQITED